MLFRTVGRPPPPRLVMPMDVLSRGSAGAALEATMRLLLDLGRQRPPRLLMPMDVISRGSARAALEPTLRVMLELGSQRQPRLLMPLDVITRGSARAAVERWDGRRVGTVWGGVWRGASAGNDPSKSRQSRAVGVGKDQPQPFPFVRRSCGVSTHHERPDGVVEAFQTRTDPVDASSSA